MIYLSMLLLLTLLSSNAPRHEIVLLRILLRDVPLIPPGT